MAIFELGDGHGTLVQPMRPSADSFEADSATLVGDHVTALLGEQVLPVRRAGVGGGPHLLAIDATGLPVVVEVQHLLDRDGLVRALRDAGSASRLSRADLARMYEGGPEKFEADVAVFRDRAPLVQAQQSRAGVRLVVVCAEVEDGLADAVSFIAGTAQVDVLRVGVTQGPGGRRYVDVQPLRGPATHERRPVEPAAATGAVAAAAWNAPTPGSQASTAPTPVVPVAGAGADPEQPAARPEGTPVDGPSPASAAPTPGRRDRSHRLAASDTEPTVPLRRSDLRTGSADPAATTLIPPVGDDDAPLVVPSRPRPELAALAAAEGPAELVWLRVRRGQRLVATLRGDGLLELEDGSLHAEPDDAATAAADLERPADGWRVWRFGDHGRTLGEAVGLPS